MKLAEITKNRLEVFDESHWKCACELLHEPFSQQTGQHHQFNVEEIMQIWQQVSPLMYDNK